MSGVTTRTEHTRERLLEATRQVLARSGPRRLHLSAVAAEAGVSRPTLYAYFPSKDDLLRALAAHEKARFMQALDAALDGLTGRARLERALTLMVEFQRDSGTRRLVLMEPEFMLDQLERSVVTMTAALVPLFQEATGVDAATAADCADLAVRTAMSHFLIPRDEAQLLREMRLIAGLT